MAELRSTIKKGLPKKNEVSSKSFSNTLNTTASHSRLSLPGSTSVRKTCKGLEIENSPYEEYTLEYSTYLLRKAQNKLLAQNVLSKKENVKKCFVSLKLEFEELLNKHIQLRKNLLLIKSYLDIIKETSGKLESGRKLLAIMRESEFENLLKALSSKLNNVIDQLQLVDINKKSIEEMFEKNIWGSGCELEECLKKIDACISKNKTQVLNIPEELKEISRLCKENLILREKFGSLFQSIHDEVLETNYSSYVNAVKKAMFKREEKDGDLNLELDLPELGFPHNIHHLQHTLEFSKCESFFMIPKGSSTPQQVFDD